MKNLLKNKYFAVFIIFSFLVYVMSNGEWCVPIFAWIYPILFLCMVYLNHTRKVYLIISFIYAIGFVIQFGRAIGVATHLSCPKINQIDCHRMSRYNGISLKKGKVPGHLQFRHR